VRPAIVITVAGVAVALLLPLIVQGSFALSMLSQMGIAIIFALSYNMLLGQGGMLSFGHAVYFGLGGFLSIHVLNAVGAGKLIFPVSLLPLVGALTGLLFGLVFGYVSTRRSGTVFAMISLGIGEMVAAMSLMLPDFFGGEAGVSGNRQVGEPVLGISYGPAVQVYYLIAVWSVIAGVLMYAWTQTPLGRMANAVRDNPERVQFIGYDPQRVRFLTLALSGAFAGIAGGLSAINYEIVSAEDVGSLKSGFILLMTFIGGIRNFFGPIIGAVLVTFLQLTLSLVSKAWPLYFGLFFVFMILFAPGGIAGVIMAHRELWQARLLSRLLPSYAAAIGAALLMLTGLVILVEINYHLRTEAADGTVMRLFGLNVDAASAPPWLAGIALLAAGYFALRACRRVIDLHWQHLRAELQQRGLV
jgi:branched-chain amino acid transport system permease protein